MLVHDSRDKFLEVWNRVIRKMWLNPLLRGGGARDDQDIVG